MKKFILILSIPLSIFITSCSDDSVTNEFEDANGQIKPKMIKSISTSSNDDALENQSVEIFYDNNEKILSVREGSDVATFVYDSDELSNIEGSGNGNINIEDLFESPYNAFETGYVLLYDDNDNPIEIEFYEDEYDQDIQDWRTFVYTAEISYDDAPNPYFFTLQAGGIIEVLDKVRLNFNMNPQVSEIVRARALFPMNNVSKIDYKNEAGDLIYTITIDYNYDDDNYPITGVAQRLSLEDDELTTYNAIFDYLD